MPTIYSPRPRVSNGKFEDPRWRAHLGTAPGARPLGRFNVGTSAGDPIDLRAYLRRSGINAALLPIFGAGAVSRCAPRWRAKRKAIMERDGWRCQAEGEHAGDLNIHHRNYTTSDPWNELDENLLTLCEKHHQAEHDHLGSAASAVADALKHSNWMVKHRRVLTRCIEEKLVSPEELTAFIEKRTDKVA